MAPLLDLYREQVFTFLFALTRISGLLLAAPALGIRSAPKYVRLLLALALTILVTSVHWDDAQSLPDDPAQLIPKFCLEAALGLTFGFALLLLTAGVRIAGQLIGQMSGMSLARVQGSDQQDQASIFSALLDLVTVAVFLLLGGHRQVISALLDTFHWMPPGKAKFVLSDGSVDLFQTVNDIAAQSFALGLRTAAPVVAALLVSTLVLGFVNRVVPRLNTLALGFSLNTLLVLAVLSLSLGGAAWVFQEEADEAVRTIHSAFQELAR